MKRTDLRMILASMANHQMRREEVEPISKDLQRALAAAPEKLTLRDEVQWKDQVARNSESELGVATIRYAELWARLMEGCIANGDTVAGCAKETSSLASNGRGVPSFRYAYAGWLLTRTWVHGDELLAWHDREQARWESDN